MNTKCTNMQTAASLKTFKQVLKSVQAGYRDGKPLHVCDPDSSAFRIISTRDLRAMTPREQQLMLGKWNIVETGLVDDVLQWDPSSLQEITHWTKDLTIHGNYRQDFSAYISLMHI